MGLRREDNETKQLFLDSVKQLGLDSARKEDGTFRTFNQMVTMDLTKKKQFEHLSKLENKRGK